MMNNGGDIDWPISQTITETQSNSIAKKVTDKPRNRKQTITETQSNSIAKKVKDKPRNRKQTIFFIDSTHSNFY